MGQFALPDNIDAGNAEVARLFVGVDQEAPLGGGMGHGQVRGHHRLAFARPALPARSPLIVVADRGLLQGIARPTAPTAPP